MTSVEKFVCKLDVLLNEEQKQVFRAIEVKNKFEKAKKASSDTKRGILK